jgi:death-on-curing protein
VTGVQYLGLADFLLVAEAVLELNAEVLAHSVDLALADTALHAPAAGFGEVEFYPGFASKAGILGYRIARNHPLIDGNKRVAYECLREFVARNGRSWTPPPGDGPGGDETVAVMIAVAAGEMSEADFIAWVADRIEECPHD